MPMVTGISPLWIRLSKTVGSPHGPFKTDVAFAVLKYHHARGLGVSILGRNINPVFMRRVGIDATGIPGVFCHRAPWHTFLR